MEEAHPGVNVVGELGRGPVGTALVEEEERLREGQQEYGVDDEEGDHVVGDDLEDHGDEGAGQLDCPAEEDSVSLGLASCKNRIAKYLLREYLWKRYPLHETDLKETKHVKHAIK